MTTKLLIGVPFAHPLPRAMYRPMVCLLVILALPSLGVSESKIDFSRDIRPILSNYCFKCHGPDEGDRQGGLRLDVRAAAISALDSGTTAIVPGKTVESALVQRIVSDDPDLKMPPPSSNKQLSDAQKAMLRNWVAEGADYQPHWAFVKPQHSVPPAVEGSVSPVQNPIDSFLGQRLQREGLAMSPEADRMTLVRRAYLDLIGILPTPEEADAFVNDASPNAYELLVDRLLASPHYGERWARRWLDLARYSDSNGYEKDRTRSIWPYRDWVINALNADMRFDQFTIRQIAGDMLPGATIDDMVATGFHRNTMLNEEGGVDPLEFSFLSNVDRVGTTATVWLGLTMACAQCHTHKYDPISHKEFYQFMAFFDQAEEPMIEVPQPDLAVRRAELESQIAAIETSLAEKLPDRSRFDQWVEQASHKAIDWTILEPIKMASNLPRLERLEDNSILASGDQTKRDVYDISLANNQRPSIRAIRLEAIPHPSLPSGGPGREYYGEGVYGDFFLSKFTAAVQGTSIKLASVIQTVGDAKGILDDVVETGWSIGGHVGQPQIAIVTLAEPIGNATQIDLQLIFEKYQASALGRFRISVTGDPRPLETIQYPTDVEAILCKPTADRTDAERGRLFNYYLTIAPELEPERAKVAELRKQLPKYPTTLAMKQRPADRYRPTQRHHRGEFLQPQEAVGAGTLEVLHALPQDAPRDRLAFAKWLVDRENPLVGRVTMNRHWAAFFGHGLVRTTEDFGTQGELPSHPELLDWLAVEFMDHGWSQKVMHKLIVMSATYRQSSRLNSDLLQRDPQNRLYARGPRVRLEAELVRDSFLAAAGLLGHKLNGPSVFPPQLNSITTEAAFVPMEWKVSEGEDRYRRSLYTFSKRSAPFAMYSTFDAPSGEACLPRRDISNTPLQALTLLNDAMFFETAQVLGQRYATTDGAMETRAADVFRRCLTRPPEADELAELVKFLQEQRVRFPNDESLVWTMLVRTILNLDEMIVKQ